MFTVLVESMLLDILSIAKLKGVSLEVAIEFWAAENHLELDESKPA